MRSALLLYFCLAASSATSLMLPLEPNQHRIIGGDVTTIDRYPSVVALLMYDCFNHVYTQVCGSSIINKRSLLTAAHCIADYVPIYYWNMRVGSSYRSSGGTVHSAREILIHPDYNSRNFANDIAIVYSSTEFEYNEYVAPAVLAGKNYFLEDDEPVWAVGWGTCNMTTGDVSEQLREVKVYTINWQKCRDRYQEIDRLIFDNMLCIGIFNIGGKSQCSGDSGGPVYHGNTVVGVCSWGNGCDSTQYPAVNALVSAYDNWISSNS